MSKPIRVVAAPHITRIVNLLTGTVIGDTPVILDPDGFIHAQLAAGKLLVLEDVAPQPSEPVRKRPPVQAEVNK